MGSGGPLIIHGSWRLKIDAQGRVLVPSAIRRMLEEAGEPQRFVIARSFNNCLTLYWESLWRHTVMEAVKNLDGKERYYWLSFIGPSAVQVSIDKAGRMTIPAELRDYAHIGSELVIVGKVFFLEAWDPKLFEVDQRDMERRVDPDDIQSKLMQSLPCSGSGGGAFAGSPRPEDGTSGDAGQG